LGVGGTLKDAVDVPEFDRTDVGRARCAVLGKYMVDKAQNDTLNTDRQAGADELERWFPEIAARAPPGITLVDLEAAEQIIYDWRDGGEHRALIAALKVYERLAQVAQR
jgi:hypothetical protein